MSDHSEAAAPEALRAAIPFRRLPWIRPLVSAVAEDFGAVADLFAGNPADPAAWRDAIERAGRAARNRPALATMLDRQLARRGAPAEARAAAATLGEPGAVAVVTGQQAGVFGGPLYTLFKAVTAVQLARRVRETHGTPAVAVFWVDADDHDWEEVRSATVLDAEFAVSTVTLGDLPGAGARPVGSLVLDSGVAGTIDALRAALAPTEFTADVISALRRRHRPGVSLSTACAGWLDDLLGRHGLVVFEADDPAGRAMAAPVFARELGEPGLTARLAREGGERMRALGHAPQVEPGDDNVAVFRVDDAGRQPVRRDGGSLLAGSAVVSAGALRAEAREHPERFSPNVLLRPIAQDTIFPTVCYIGGPSELAYHAQLGEVYRAFGVERPLVASRASATLLDSAAARFLDRSGVAFEALQPQDESALNALLATGFPPGLEDALAAFEREIDRRVAALRDPISAVDPTLLGAVDTTGQRLRDVLKALHGKVVQASKRKDDTLRRQFLRTRALAFPAGAPQERLLNVAFFANRYGLAIADRLLDTLPVEADAHYVIV